MESMVANEKQQQLIPVPEQQTSATNEPEVKEEDPELEEDMLEPLMKR